MSDRHERRLRELARQQKMKPGPFARRIVIAFLEHEDGPGVADSGRLGRIERYMPTLARLMLRLERKVDAFLDNAELVDPN